MQERLKIFLLGILLATAMTSVASCSPNKEFQKRSELAQLFYDAKLETGVRYQRLQRDPGRLIKTPLRPSLMRAKIPSAYLVSIIHPWGPYAKQVWDFAHFDFNLNTLAPAPATDFIGVNKGGRTIGISLGGWSAAYRYLAKRPAIDGAKILSSSPQEVIWKYGTDQKHTLYSRDMVEIDGTPIVISCSKICNARLTITPDMAGLPVKEPRGEGYGPEGVALEVSFDARLLPQWRDIRIKAICFAAFSIVGFKYEGLEQSPACVAVKRAIAAALPV
jgi:hypothetical protein